MNQDSPNQKKPSQEDVEKNISNEITRLIESLANIEVESNGAIYDSYIKLKASLATLSQKLTSEPHTNVLNDTASAEISQEISDLMKSFDNLEAISDEAIYDKYVKVKASMEEISRILHLKIQSIPQKGEIPLPVINTLEEKKDTFPGEAKRRVKRKFIPQVRKQSNKIWLLGLLILATAIVFAIISHKPSLNRLAKKIPPPQEENKQITTKDKKIELVQIPSFEKKDIQNDVGIKQPAEPKLTSTLPIKPTDQTHSVLKNFLEENPDSEKIMKKLMQIVNDGNFIPQDIFLLQNLYFSYNQNENLRIYIIACAGAIGDENAQKWLREILQKASNPMDRISAIEALGKKHNEENRIVLLQNLQQEQDIGACTACADALSKMAPYDQDVYQSLIAKFYEVTDENIRMAIISAISNIKIKSRRFFLEEILGNSTYEFPLREKTLEELINHAYKYNEKEIVSQFLNGILEKEQNPVLQTRIREAIKILNKD